MIFDGDIESNDVKISIKNASSEVRSEIWGTLISSRKGEKKGGGEFLGGGELIGRIRYSSFHLFICSLLRRHEERKPSSVHFTMRNCMENGIYDCLEERERERE